MKTLAQKHFNKMIELSEIDYDGWGVSEKDAIKFAESYAKKLLKINKK